VTLVLPFRPSNYPKMFSALVNVISNFKDTVATANGPVEDLVKPTSSKLSADSPPFVPSSAPENENECEGVDENEYEPQSASMDAEIGFEMEECLNEIMKEKLSAMNFSAAAKLNLSTISKKAQRAPLLRTQRERSCDDPKHSVSCSKELSFEDESASSSGEDENDDLKSFGRYKVQQYYRTKPERDEARRRHLEMVAKRSGRRPNDRNVAAQVHHLSRHQLKSAARGGRHASRTADLVLQQ